MRSVGVGGRSRVRFLLEKPPNLPHAELVEARNLPQTITGWRLGSTFFGASDGLYYVGSHRGPDPANRVAQHNAGVDIKAFTYPRRPVELVWAEGFQRIVDAIAAERQLKGWSRAKKEALMAGDWRAVQALSRSKTPAEEG